MAEIDGDCRIRDIVRDSKILRDIPSKPYQMFDSSSSMVNRDLDGWRHRLYYGHHRVGRDFPRTTKDGVAAGIYLDSHMESNTKEERQVLCSLNQNLRKVRQPVNGFARDLSPKSSIEQRQRFGFTPSVDEFDYGLKGYKEMNDPFHGLYCRHGGLIYKFKQNLPVFDGFWHTKDIMSWIVAIDDFFEEIKPPEHVKCNIVWYKMEGRAYYWWKQFQLEWNEHGNKEATSWAMMKNMILNKFSPTTCSTKGPNEKDSPKQSKDCSPSNSSRCVDLILETPIDEIVEETNNKSNNKYDEEVTLQDVYTLPVSLSLIESDAKTNPVLLEELKNDDKKEQLNVPEQVFHIQNVDPQVSSVSFDIKHVLKFSCQHGNGFQLLGFLDCYDNNSQAVATFCALKMLKTCPYDVDFFVNNTLMRTFDPGGYSSRENMFICATHNCETKLRTDKHSLAFDFKASAYKGLKERMPSGAFNKVTHLFAHEYVKMAKLWLSRCVADNNYYLVSPLFDPGGTLRNELNTSNDKGQSVVVMNVGPRGEFALLDESSSPLATCHKSGKPRQSLIKVGVIKNVIKHIFVMKSFVMFNKFSAIKDYKKFSESYSKNCNQTESLEKSLCRNTYSAMYVVSLLASNIESLRELWFEEGNLGPRMRNTESCSMPLKEKTALAVENINSDPDNSWTTSAYGGEEGAVSVRLQLFVKRFVPRIRTSTENWLRGSFHVSVVTRMIDRVVRMGEVSPWILFKGLLYSCVQPPTASGFMVHEFDASINNEYQFLDGGESYDFRRELTNYSDFTQSRGCYHRSTVFYEMLLELTLTVDSPLTPTEVDSTCRFQSMSESYGSFLDSMFRNRPASMLIGQLVKGKCGRVNCDIRKLVTFLFDPDGAIGPIKMWRTCWSSRIVISTETGHYFVVLLCCPSKRLQLVQAPRNKEHYVVITGGGTIDMALRGNIPPVDFSSDGVTVYTFDPGGSEVYKKCWKISLIWRPAKLLRTIRHNRSDNVAATLMFDLSINVGNIGETPYINFPRSTTSSQQSSNREESLSVLYTFDSPSYLFMEIKSSFHRTIKCCQFVVKQLHYIFYITRGRVIPQEGWSDEHNNSSFMRARQHAVTVSLCLSFGGKNGQRTLNLFCSVVNGLDPPNGCIGESGDVSAALDSSSYWIYACGQAF